MNAKPQGAGGPPPQRPPNTDMPAPIPSASILQGRDAVSIEHNGRLYQLRQTRQGKLILTN
jgi:hemin uptake protein HemP